MKTSGCFEQASGANSGLTIDLLHHEVIISDSYTGNSAPPVFIISSSSSSAVSAKSRAASRVSASSSSSSSPSPCSDNSSARLSLSSPELLSELKQSRTRSLRHVRTHSGLTTIFSGRGRRGGEQITASTQDVVHLSASTSALIRHPMFLPLLNESVYYSHFHPLCKVNHHLTFCVPVLKTKPAHNSLITSVPFTYMSIEICTNDNSLTSGDALHHFI
ncbi:uncharacterized protein [Channa argus]|uniref:uncharacterized protein isoform X3 n=1 Tax=Channa argus TaxID=215402 RepID=UPI0035202C99